MNNRGWMRILEAVVGVLIVSGAMLAVYNDQPRQSRSISEYSYSLQEEILADIVMNATLRLEVLNVSDDQPGDYSYDILNEFVAERIPDSFGYLLRVCELGDTTDYCKMDSVLFIATIDEDIFVDEVVVSSEIGDGTGEEVYSPKKVRLFFWEGGFPEGVCSSECSDGETDLYCSWDSAQVLEKTCGDSDGDGCFEWDSGTVAEDCSDGGETCDGEVCVDNSYTQLVCGEKVVESPRCEDTESNMMIDVCPPNGYTDYFWVGDTPEMYLDDGCSHSYYSCFKWENEETTECSLNPECPSGKEQIGEDSSCDPCVSDCSVANDVSYSCDGDDLVTSTCLYDGSGCLKWNDVSVTCSGSCTGGACDDVAAVLSASYSDKNPQGYYVYYTSTISESNGVGVTISSRQKCYVGSVSGSFCDDIKYDIATDYGSDYVPAGGSISDTTNYFWTDESSWITTETFWGTDDNGNSVSASYSISK